MRISGPNAARVFSICVPDVLPKPREVTLREIRDEKRQVVDRALALWFAAPHSFTGENVVELHVHGGRAIIHAVTRLLGEQLSMRLAEPGEFTRRAFENGKLDLTEAEAVADLVNAETEAQRRQAMRQFDGELARIYEDWRARLTRILAYLEASIDFSEEDLPRDMEEKQTSAIRLLLEEIARHLDDRRRGERLREGFEIAILGPPNAGKSSLLNVLARRDAAIVSAIAGTTRDIVEVHLDLGGYPVILADTAGLRETTDVIENEGVRRALARAEKADLKMLVFDGEKWPRLDDATQALADESSIAIVNKADMIGFQHKGDDTKLFISAKSGAGVSELLDRLIAEIELRFSGSAEPALTRERHRAALEDCAAHIQRALQAPVGELRAEDMRLAVRALGRITGRVDVEDLLDVIFRDFCIGK